MVGRRLIGKELNNDKRWLSSLFLMEGSVCVCVCVCVCVYSLRAFGAAHGGVGDDLHVSCRALQENEAALAPLSQGGFAKFSQQRPPVTEEQGLRSQETSLQTPAQPLVTLANILPLNSPPCSHL